MRQSSQLWPGPVGNETLSLPFRLGSMGLGVEKRAFETRLQSILWLGIVLFKCTKTATKQIRDTGRAS